MNCQQPEGVQLPTRVLKVGQKGDNVVLVESQGSIGTYAILSYCWGESATLTTTRDTIAARKHGIADEALPLTLRHAVDVTRQLGIKYLWVDAL